MKDKGAKEVLKRKKQRPEQRVAIDSDTITQYRDDLDRLIDSMSGKFEELCIVAQKVSEKRDQIRNAVGGECGAVGSLNFATKDGEVFTYHSPLDLSATPSDDAVKKVDTLCRRLTTELYNKFYDRSAGFSRANKNSHGYVKFSTVKDGGAGSSDEGGENSDNDAQIRDDKAA
jgi:hypothetical protein